MLDIKQIESFFPEQLRPFKKNLLREYLQYKILEAIFESSLADKLIFMGGTCIHIVHGSPRFSEDLDFDNPGIGRDDFKALSQKVKKTLELQGYTVELKNTFTDAFRAYLRFPGLLHATGISGHWDEKLLIQIDTEPQGVQYNQDKFILNKFDVFSRINVVPTDILAAQKIYCIFNRHRPMGRDFFDVIFLLGKSDVNFEYLTQKISIRNRSDLRERLLLRCAQLDFKRLAKDLEPFVYSKKNLNRVLMFPDFVRQEI
ncbi:MAG: nucleotidyl transferase AbiEii/AbiGii toxin family protein [Thermodesulfobacteriota bacterium]|nr:nucleotidyl transferase AbiEii/AbiGii toxin family protein [Thermodesulfobacteriota bacterium]